METQDEKKTIVQFALRKGLVLGVIHVFVNVLLYVLFPSKLAGFSYLAFVILINLIYSIYCVIEWRREQSGGYISFSKAFQISILILIFNGLLSSLIFPIVHSSIDDSYAQVYVDAQVDTSVYWAQRFGAPEEALEDMREKMDTEELTKRYGSITGISTGFGMAILFYGLGSLIVALIARKNEPIDL